MTFFVFQEPDESITKDHFWTDRGYNVLSFMSAEADEDSEKGWQLWKKGSKRTLSQVFLGPILWIRPDVIRCTF